MAKQTLKHAVGNEIATRQTARNYTHVLVGTLNKERALANLARKFAGIQKDADEYRADLEKSHANYRAMLATPKGQMCKNWNGWLVKMDDFYHEQSQKGLNDYGTVEEQVAEYIERRQNDIEADRKKYESSECLPQVFSWHSRYDLAEKAAGTSRYKNFDFKVEAINNGAAA